MDKNLYDLPPAELSAGPDRLRVARARRSTALDGRSRTSCSRATCSPKDQIEAYIELKWPDVARWEMTPSPVEFDMYYSS